MTFQIERLICLSAEDAEALRRVYAEYDEHTVPTIEDLRLATTASSVFVARADSNEIVGFLTLFIYRRMKGVTAQVEDVAVVSAHRRQGAGRLLIKTALEYARRAHCADVHLSTYPDMATAIALYRSQAGTEKTMKVFKWTL